MKYFVIFLVLISPTVAFAQPLVPTDCGGVGQPECGYKHLLQMVDTIINWLIMISVPISAGVMAWAGIIYMTTGIADKKAQAKSMLIKVFIGFVAILSAWIIVSTILNVLVNPNIRNSLPV